MELYFECKREISKAFLSPQNFQKRTFLYFIIIKNIKNNY